jgi:hypothetical protein
LLAALMAASLAALLAAPKTGDAGAQAARAAPHHSDRHQCCLLNKNRANSERRDFSSIGNSERV